jgi:uncharacterized protein (DUF305 family)
MHSAGNLTQHGGEMKQSYKMFFTMMALHFVVMYLIMYTMINSLADFYNNLNQTYMTLMMVASMALIMIFSMKDMYTKKMIKILSIGSIIVFIFGYAFMRNQTIVGDKQFLKSMIPHHSGAILMCREAKITDEEIHKLCEEIKASQQSEIDQMKKILERL